MRAVVKRFANVPWLCWDLINEPSFSNPRIYFKVNVPNGDPAEVDAWHKWLQEKYKVSTPWRTHGRRSRNNLGSFDSIPLPGTPTSPSALWKCQSGSRARLQPLCARHVQPLGAHDGRRYPRPAASSSSTWAKMKAASPTACSISSTALAGVSFTTNHTYWQDDALLWDSVAAKRPGMPNITGETGYQPVWAPDGTWRYDEFTGLPLTERKWALGFAAGSSRRHAVGLGARSRLRHAAQRRLGESMGAHDAASGRVRQRAAPYATGFIKPRFRHRPAAVPPALRFQCSGVEAQQNAVRALITTPAEKLMP